MTAPGPVREGAAAVVEALGLQRHPEGGWYRETHRSPAPDGQRAACTAIHFLLADGEESAWHRVDADEVWTHTAGAPLELSVAPPSRELSRFVLGSGVLQGQLPHAVVPAGAWQAARPLGAWSLVCCVVAPGFEFTGFELAEGGPDTPPPTA